MLKNAHFSVFLGSDDQNQPVFIKFGNFTIIITCFNASIYEYFKKIVLHTHVRSDICVQQKGRCGYVRINHAVAGKAARCPTFRLPRTASHMPRRTRKTAQKATKIRQKIAIFMVFRSKMAHFYEIFSFFR
ncbi:MAG: hypothetical protein EOM20_20970 [Spartobacteria bacterium]|nr:hypothetical protein [Spartobacteria bacterium]